MSKVIRTGAAFAITVAVGSNFSRLQSGPTLFSFGSFVYALIVMTAWAFGLGVLFGWISGWLGRARPE